MSVLPFELSFARTFAGAALLLGTATHGLFYRICFVCFLTGGISYRLSSIFGLIGIVALLLAAIPMLLATVLLILAALMRSIWWFAKGRYIVGVGHLCAIIVGGAMFPVGMLGGSLLGLAYVVPQMELALANYRAGNHGDEGDVELISIDPEVVAYPTSYVPGFAAPGYTQFIVLDTTGRFASLASQGHVRELASSRELQSRSYKAYCYLHLAPMIGSFYFAIAFDEDGCERG